MQVVLFLEFYQDKHRNFANDVYKTALEKGLVLRKSFDGLGPSLVLKPPLIVSVTEISRAMKLLAESIHEVIETVQ